MKNRLKLLLLVLVVMFMVVLLCPKKAQAECWNRPGFWFLDARVKLVPTNVFVTVPTGYWGGWYWYKWDSCTWRPYYGAAWAPICQYNRPYCPLYCPPYCPRNIMDMYPWQGGYYFWGFLDRLTFKFTFWRPVVVWWWTWYPSVYVGPSGDTAFALELVTLVDEEEGKLLPLNDDVLNNLSILDHDFSVNGGESTGVFDPCELVVTVQDVPNRYMQLLTGTGMPLRCDGLSK